MKLGTILVHLDPSQRCAVRVELAAALAKKHGSHLIGLIPTGLYDSSIPADALAPGGPGFMAASAEYLRKRAEAMADAFRRMMQASGTASFDIRATDAPSVDAVVRHGRTSDLVVLGQSGGDDTEGMTARNLPEQATIHTGRPVLIVPRSWLLQPVGGRILVAWDGSRESAVALQASLPLLADAAAVSLVSLREEGEAADAGALQISPALAWLNRHGIRAEAEQHTTATGTAEALRFHAARMSADLLVMGGYGHPRLRELMLGGVTRDMLARMNLPVLMAH